MRSSTRKANWNVSNTNPMRRADWGIQSGTRSGVADTFPKRTVAAIISYACTETTAQKTAPIVPYYERRGLLRRGHGEGAVADVRRRVTDALGVGVPVFS